MSTIATGDLLYHAVHGACRVVEVDKQKQSGKQALYYSLVPKVASQMKARFIVEAAGMEASGFHAFVSLKEANKILDYLKDGDKKPAPSAAGHKGSVSFSEQGQTWGFARTILSSSHEKFEAKDQRKRQLLARSAKGLVGELAFVFKISLKETAAKIQKSLGPAPKINLSVLAAIAKAAEE